MTPQPGPLVSVVMATYNGAAFVRDTIDSVLTQTMPDLEIVIVDDGSRDDTLQVLAAISDPRVRVVQSGSNSGPAVARTIAMGHARGRFIAGLDQDDLCRPDRFARQLAYLDAHPDVVLVATTIEMFGAESVRPDPYPALVDPSEIDWTMLLLNPLGWSTVMIRGEAARALDPFERDEMRFAEDFDLYQRIRAHGRIGRIAEPMVRYRMHPGGASNAHEERMLAATADVLVERYRPIFGDGAIEAAMLMARHAGGGYATPDIATLARCGDILDTLVETQGHLAPGFAKESASRLWWRIARMGLRWGRYTVRQVIGARPAVARTSDVLRLKAAEDMAIGTARRWLGRSL
jgi:glycosyltransferase involved in cell wall biosynthesis